MPTMAAADPRTYLWPLRSACGNGQSLCLADAGVGGCKAEVLGLSNADKAGQFGAAESCPPSRRGLWRRGCSARGGPGLRQRQHARAGLTGNRASSHDDGGANSNRAA